jgi:carbon-monoxide dehydrogenase medium subunit
MKPSAFDYKSPTSLEEAIRFLQAGEGNAKIISGGQSLMPMMAFRLAVPEVLVDLKHVPDLDQIEITSEGVRLGARVRWSDISRDTRLTMANPLLAEAITHVAHYQVRNRGTVGGSLAHADPSAELPGVAVTCDAILTIVGPDGSRNQNAADFFVGPLETSLASDEVLTSLLLPAWPAGRRWSFREFARRKGDFAMAGISAFYDPDPEGRATNVHIGCIGVSDTPRRLPGAEAALNGQRPTDDVIQAVVAAANAEIDPPSDIHAPAEYRRGLVGTLLTRSLVEAASR